LRQVFSFFENDWQLIVTQDLMVRRIEAAIALLKTSQVDCVRFRHREEPGEPLYTKIFEGREIDQIIHLLDCIDWIAHPEEIFPHYTKRFESLNEVFYVTKSSHANYKNNP
jgi:hypothetical protein